MKTKKWIKQKLEWILNKLILFFFLMTAAIIIMVALCNRADHNIFIL